jgi:hypothetical protein
MADASYVQSSFLGGEASQFIQGRYDLQNYRTFMNVCLNFIVLETGAVVRRPGFRNAGFTRLGQPARVVKFDFRQDAPYTMEFTDLFVRFRSGAELVTTNDSVSVNSISAANPAVVETATAPNWPTLSQVYFTGLGTTAPLLQNRTFILINIDASHYTLEDGVTGTPVDGTALGWVATSGATLNRVLDLVTPFAHAQWEALRSVQTEKTAVLLTGTLPYAVTVTAEPVSDPPRFATFSIDKVVFNDGPYLDAFTNGVQANPNQTTGIVQITLSFPTWLSTTAYAIGAFVTRSGINYKSLVDQNINHDPALGGAFWVQTTASSALGEHGLQAGDVGRLVRLFSEPPMWAAGTTYSTGQVVSFNPSGRIGATTYWLSATGPNTGNTPGRDVTNWRIMTSDGVAIWTWGKITSLTNVIPGNITGSTTIGDMTAFGGNAAAFDGTFSKSGGNSAVKEIAGGAQPDNQVVTLSSYIGKNYSSLGGKKIDGVTFYPPNDAGFAFGSYDTPQGRLGLANIFWQANLRGSMLAPTTPSDGTLLSPSGLQRNTLAPVTMESHDKTTAWRFVWLEVIATATVGANVTSYDINTGMSQVLFFSSGSTGTDAGMNVEILGPPLYYVSPIREWRLGVYSDAAGWPTCGTYSEGRLWLSGAVPNRIDASASNGIVGSIVDFAPTNPLGTVLASSGISYVFNAPDANPIFWMTPDLQGILCGTKAGEWLVQAPTSGPISATNIAAKRVTTIGCADIEPRRTEHTTVFVQKFGRKIMEMFPDVFSGKFTAPHLTFSGKHLTRGGVDEIAYQQELAPVVWATVAGALIGCTYKRDTLMTSQGPSAAGWHRHVLGSGRTVESIAVGPSVGGNVDALTIVTNDPAGVGRHVEVMTDILDEGAARTDAFYVDDAVSATSYTEVAADTGMPYGGLALNGLWHLNGKTVTFWLGGLDCGDHLVTNGSATVPYGDGVSGGTGGGLFTSDFVAAFAGNMPTAIGFTYTSDGQIVRPNTPQETGARSGPGFGKLRRTHQFAAQLESTQGVSFGTTFANLSPAQFRLANDTAYTPLQQFTGIYQGTLEDNESFDGMICWRVTRPYICNLTAIGGRIATQDG